jgi:hypothetical protein
LTVPLNESDVRGVVDTDVDELPAEPFAASTPVALASAITGDAVSNAIDPAELLDIDMDQLAGMLALVAAGRLGRLERAQLAEAETSQDARDGGLGDMRLPCDLPTRSALAAERLDTSDDLGQCRPTQAMRPGRAIAQTGNTFRPEPIDPFAHCARAGAYGCTDGLRRLPVLDNPPHHRLSTCQRQRRILMDVHWFLRGSPKLQQLQLPQSEPNGQPVETSHLEHKR